MSDWKNPYLVVREDGIGFVDLSNHEVHILKPDEIPAELASLPSSAWPYGRVVLVAEAVPKIPTDQAKAEVRKNRALLVGTLKELDVQIQNSVTRQRRPHERLRANDACENCPTIAGCSRCRRAARRESRNAVRPGSYHGRAA